MGTLQSSSTMGIDIKAGGRIKNGNRKAPTTENVYIRLLVKLYRFLARRTEANFNKVVLKRLFMSRHNRPPLSISKLSKFMRQQEGKMAVIVGTVTDDVRMLECPRVSRSVLCVSPRLLAHASSLRAVRSSPSISSLSCTLLGPTACSFVVHASLARLCVTGLDTVEGPLVLRATLHHTSAPRAASSRRLVVVVRPVASSPSLAAHKHLCELISSLAWLLEL